MPKLTKRAICLVQTFHVQTDPNFRKSFDFDKIRLIFRKIYCSILGILGFNNINKRPLDLNNLIYIYLSFRPSTNVLLAKKNLNGEWEVKISVSYKISYCRVSGNLKYLYQPLPKKKLARIIKLRLF